MGSARGLYVLYYVRHSHAPSCIIIGRLIFQRVRAVTIGLDGCSRDTSSTKTRPDRCYFQKHYWDLQESRTTGGYQSSLTLVYAMICVLSFKLTSTKLSSYFKPPGRHYMARTVARGLVISSFIGLHIR